MANINGTAGNDSLTGTAAADLIQGLGSNDTLIGGDGSDTLKGGDGDDSMVGGAGSDAYYVTGTGDKVVEGANSGIDIVHSTLAAYTLGANVENLRLLSAGAANGTGNAQNNVIYAGDGDNVMNGGAGTDTVSYLYASGAVTVSLAVAGAQATGGSGSDTLLNFENLTGSAHNDSLTGNAQANVLNGGLGADTLTGGNGNDSYYVNVSGDTIVETMAGGVDTVYSNAAGYIMGANIENLRIIATGASNAFGNGRANTITAGAGDNLMNGGAGIDMLSYANAGAGVKLSLELDYAQATGSSGTDTVKNFEKLTGSAYNDTLTGGPDNNTINGGEGNDSIAGGAGDDYLNGGAGDDTMSGENGVDTYIVNSAGDTIVNEHSGWGDTVRSQISAYTLGDGLEILVITSNGTASGTGNSSYNTIFAGKGDNTIDGGDADDWVDYSQGATGAVTVDLAAGTATGGSGNDTILNIESVMGTAFNDSLSGSGGNETLDGGAGADTLVGGGGNDTYYIDNAGDQIIADGSGYERVYSSAASYTLGTDFEMLVIDTDGAANGFGNALANRIVAGDGDNVLDGGGGNGDELSYDNASAGVTVSLAITGPQDTGGSGTDTISNFKRLDGSSYDDSLTGDGQDNQLSGASGNDTMAGGLGNDIYYVGQSADVVVENADEGTDHVFASANFTLPDNVESISVHTTDALHLTGSAGNNTLSGYISNDTLTGGAGADTFKFLVSAQGGNNIDTITDFGTGADVIALDNFVFSSLSEGALGADNFHLGTAALDADDFIIYDATSGALYYDYDGTGSGAQAQFAILSGNPTLDAGDFIVT